MQNIFLIGPMGAGKTTVGRHLAQQLEFDFIDSDKEIAARAGANLAWIFDLEGEAGFRKREELVIAELTGLKNIVLATGGGVVLSPNNRTLLASRGLVIFLQVSVEQQLSRIEHAKDRPLLLQDIEREKILNKLFAEREPLYREIADLVINTDNRSPRAITMDILTRLPHE